MCQSIRCSCQFPNISLDQRLNRKAMDKEFHIKRFSLYSTGCVSDDQNFDKTPNFAQYNTI